MSNVCEEASGEPLRRGAVVISYTDVQSEAALKVQLEAALEAGEKDLVVDLGNVRMVSSDLLETLQRVGTRLRADAGGLTVVCRHPELTRLLDLTLLSQAFVVASSRSEALRERS